MILGISGLAGSGKDQFATYLGPVGAVTVALADPLKRIARDVYAFTDEQLWGLMFGPALPRSWMVWSDGQGIRAVRASAPGVYADCAQFERTVFLVDLSPEQFYLLDIFRVVGGSDHLKCVGSSFGAITTAGVNPNEAVEPRGELQVRNVKRDPAPPPGWSVEWNLSLQGEACYLQRNAEGRLTRAALFHGTRLTTGDFTLIAKQPVEFLEVAVTDGTPAVVAGDADAVAELRVK